MEVALHLFGTQGFAATTTKQIAQAAGITEGLIFRYFPTKVSILQAIAKERDTLAQQVAHILKDAETQSARVVLERIAATWMDVTRRETNFMSMLISEGQINSDMNDTLRVSIAEAIGHLAHYLHIRRQAGDIRPDVPFHTSAASFFAALLLFFITHRHLTDEEWHGQASIFIPELLDSWLHGAQVVLDNQQRGAHPGGDHDAR